MKVTENVYKTDSDQEIHKVCYELESPDNKVGISGLFCWK